MVSQAKVVVGAEVQNLSSLTVDSDGDLASLGPNDDPLVLPKPIISDLIERRGQSVVEPRTCCVSLVGLQTLETARRAGSASKSGYVTRFSM